MVSLQISVQINPQLITEHVEGRLGSIIPTLQGENPKYNGLLLIYNV